MHKIKLGDTYAFASTDKTKYGLIQIIKKGKIGFHVRVFYYMQSELEKEHISEVLNSNHFYYLRDFYEYELLNKSDKFVGNFSIPDFVCLPRYTRKSERKSNGILMWYIIDKKLGKVIETLREFNPKLSDLSPDSTWGIDYIKRRWEEGFTLELWNNQLEDKWYDEYLKRCKTDDIIEKDKSFISLEISKPTVKWIKKFNESSENRDLYIKAIHEIDHLLNIFRNNINTENLEILNTQTKDLILKLNNINSKYQFIETEEASELIEYISKVIQLSSFADDVFDYESIIKW